MADNKESIIQDLPVKSEEISKEQLQARDFKKNPLTQDQFDALFPPLEWPEDSRIQELSEEQLYDCLPLFDAARMFLLSNQQIENFDFGHPNFQNHPHKSDLIDKGLFKYQIPLGHPDSFLIERGFDKRILTNYRNRMQLIRESQINHIIPYVSITMIEYITLPQFKMLDFKKLKKDQLDELFLKNFRGPISQNV
ncbi:MAG: hypothetical protein HWD61_03920 [Parachlamydiaceae bacterium]|nr:MAG: hypothetical protein HWD61_03920 [Parachlamydiaceae bacterium]